VICKISRNLWYVASHCHSTERTQSGTFPTLFFTTGLVPVGLFTWLKGHRTNFTLTHLLLTIALDQLPLEEIRCSKLNMAYSTPSHSSISPRELSPEGSSTFLRRGAGTRSSSARCWPCSKFSCANSGHRPWGTDLSTSTLMNHLQSPHFLSSSSAPSPSQGSWYTQGSRDEVAGLSPPALG
jgi:hypothetical protein